MKSQLNQIASYKLKLEQSIRFSLSRFCLLVKISIKNCSLNKKKLTKIEQLEQESALLKKESKQLKESIRFLTERIKKLES